MFAQPKERFDGVGTDRQTHLIEAKLCGRLELMLEIAGKPKAHTGRCHGVEEWGALVQGVVGEPVGLENLLARQKRHGIIAKLTDQGATGGQLVKARAQLRQYRAGLGTPSWQEAQ